MSDVKLDHDVWVVIADGEKGLFLRNEGDKEYPHLVVVREFKEENPPTREQGTDQPGRNNDGPTAHRSAVEETDWHRIAKERFAVEIAEKLYRLAHRDVFTKLVIVAPPVVLGELRKQLHKEVADKVTAEVPKTLTNHPIDEIEQILQAA